MGGRPVERKLAAILSGDVEGYSRLMGDNEMATVRTITEHREAIASSVAGHGGRVVDAPGDNVLAEFSSAVDAVESAVEIQRELQARSAGLPVICRMQFRIGINLGDVIVAGPREWFGKGGEDLHRKARGLSDDPVTNERERKSVGEQETFDTDSLDPAFVLGRAQELASTVFRRFVAERFSAFRTVTVTVRYSGFMTVSRSRTGKTPFTSEAELQAEVRQLLEPFFDARENPKGKKIRLIGVPVEKLLPAE